MTLFARLSGQSSRSRLMEGRWQGGAMATQHYRELASRRLAPGLRVLHAGCGRDKNEVTTSHRDMCDLVGIDIDAAAVAEYHGPVVLGSLDRAPFGDELFDVILCEYVIEHLTQPEFALREMRRLLRRGGSLLLLTPNLFSYKSLVAHTTPFWFHTWAGRIRYGSGHETDMYPTHYRCNTYRALRQAAIDTGFSVASVAFVTNGPTWFERFPVLFEAFHVIHLAMERWEWLRQLRCAILLELVRDRTLVGCQVVNRSAAATGNA